MLARDTHINSMKKFVHGALWKSKYCGKMSIWNPLEIYMMHASYSYFFTQKKKNSPIFHARWERYFQYLCWWWFIIDDHGLEIKIICLQINFLWNLNRNFEVLRGSHMLFNCLIFLQNHIPPQKKNLRWVNLRVS